MEQKRVKDTRENNGSWEQRRLGPGESPERESHFIPFHVCVSSFYSCSCLNWICFVLQSRLIQQEQKCTLNKRGFRVAACASSLSVCLESGRPRYLAEVLKRSVYVVYGFLSSSTANYSNGRRVAGNDAGCYLQNDTGLSWEPTDVSSVLAFYFRLSRVVETLHWIFSSFFGLKQKGKKVFLFLFVFLPAPWSVTDVEYRMSPRSLQRLIMFTISHTAHGTTSF